MLAGAWQLQRRGAAHVHVVLPATAWGRAWVEAVAEAAVRHDFGFVDRKIDPHPPLYAATYIARYLVSPKKGSYRAGMRQWAEWLPRKVAWVSPT